MGIEIIDVSTIDSLEKVQKIDQGATSEVFKVNKKKRLALKKLEIGFFVNEGGEFDHFKRYLQEYEIINNLDRLNIIHAFGFCFGDSTNSPSILLEFC